MLSAAAATVLGNFFCDDSITFEDTSEIGGGAVLTRSFDGFQEAAEEAGASRIYGGIHWSFDNTAGLEAGRDVGRLVSNRLLRPRGGGHGRGDGDGQGHCSPFRDRDSGERGRDSFFDDGDEEVDGEGRRSVLAGD